MIFVRGGFTFCSVSSFCLTGGMIVFFTTEFCLVVVFALGVLATILTGGFFVAVVIVLAIGFLIGTVLTFAVAESFFLGGSLTITGTFLILERRKGST